MVERGAYLLTLYTNNCPKCKILKKKLDDAGLDYTISENMDEVAEMGFKTVPVLVKKMNFSEAVQWLAKK